MCKDDFRERTGRGTILKQPPTYFKIRCVLHLRRWPASTIRLPDDQKPKRGSLEEEGRKGERGCGLDFKLLCLKLGEEGNIPSGRVRHREFRNQPGAQSAKSKNEKGVGTKEGDRKEADNQGRPKAVQREQGLRLKDLGGRCQN